MWSTSGRAARAEHLLELVRSRDFELVVAAVLGPFVGTPSEERRCVTEAIALHVIVFDLAHALDAQRFPGQVLACAPAAVTAGHPCPGTAGVRPLAPGMRGQRILPQ